MSKNKPKKKLENYIADKPVSKKIQDRFQRYPFSKRIADTIKKRKSDESIVFGLYGDWGEGKTSVINFISEELKKDKSIVSIHFNPWRYNDEHNLLFNFFKKITESLELSLKNNKEKFADIIGKIGSVGSVLGYDGSNLGKLIVDTDLEEFKNRVDKILSSSSKRLVIFIDDIDRLDKEEIYALFRLIKLTADFSNTLYVLSFDKNMVAAALGDRFSGGEKSAGDSFLEKIIQIPLTIPKAQTDDLKLFCFDLINNALDSNSIDIPKKDANRFVYQFTTNIVGRLKTPRLAVRYSNAISFSIPLLDGEVNICDLMLIEALKIFYPEHYQFVKNNPSYFIGAYGKFSLDGRTKQEKIDALKKHLEELSIDLNSFENKQVKELLSKMFPKIRIVLDNLTFSEKALLSWQNQKLIGSASYFDRYFSYTVLNGDISDIEFDSFIDTIGDNSSKDSIAMIKGIIKKSSDIKFIQKLRSKENLFNWEKGIIISNLLIKMSDSFSNKGSVFNLNLDSSQKQAAIFIYQILSNHKNKSNHYTTAKKLLTDSSGFEFACELYSWYNTGDAPKDELFNEKQYLQFKKILVKKGLNESKKENIFSKFPKDCTYILKWWSEINNAEAQNYIDEFLNKKKNNFIHLIKAYAPLITSTTHPKPFIGDFFKANYSDLKEVVNPKLIYNKIEKHPFHKILNKEEIKWRDRGGKEIDEINLVRQFVQWYNLDTKAEVITD